VSGLSPWPRRTRHPSALPVCAEGLSPTEPVKSARFSSPLAGSLGIQGHSPNLSPRHSKQALAGLQVRPRQRVAAAKLSPVSFPLPMLGQVAIEQQVITEQEAVVVNVAAAEFQGYQLMREAQPSTPQEVQPG
jgi:hypothetical protein